MVQRKIKKNHFFHHIINVYLLLELIYSQFNLNDIKI